MSTEPVSQCAIELSGVTKRFGKQVAVEDLTLQIPAGRTLGLIGPNGAGKTTTIRMLMGILPMTAGRARVLGIDPAVDPVLLKRVVGYVPEMHFIYRTMRVREVLGFCRPFYPTWNDRLCADLMSRLGLDLGKKVEHLSRGTLAKLALLLALAHEPAVLILDEPMTGLDPLAREEFLDGVVRSLCDRPRALLFSSHILSDVQRMADMIGIMHEGRLLVSCTTEELLSTTKRIRAVLRDGCVPDRPPAGTIWQRFERREWLMTVRGFTPASVDAVRNRYPVESVEVFDLGLEEIFKDYIRGRKGPA
jgi:ABC-2 type transport system ATP-binding protein